MEVLFEIDETDGLLLEKIMSHRRISLSEALKEAIEEYVKKHEITNIQYDVFGSFKANGTSGAALQKQLREGWKV